MVEKINPKSMAVILFLIGVTLIAISILISERPLDASSLVGYAGASCLGVGIVLSLKK